MGNGTSRSRTVDLESATYVVHYRSTLAQGLEPIVELRLAPGTVGALHLVAGPKASALLERPGVALAATVHGKGQLIVTVQSQGDGPLPETEVTVERLQDLVNRAADRSRRPRPSAAAAASGWTTLRAVLHVAGLGDVASTGSWSPGETAEAPIEGLSLQCSAPTDALCLEYRVRVAGPTGKQTAWARAGTFVGSRGRSLPVTAVSLRLTGAEAKRFFIEAAGRFAGGHVRTERGSEISLQGPSAFEPLTALRVSVREIGLSAQAATPEPRGRTATPESAAAASRLKIFKRGAGP